MTPGERYVTRPSVGRIVHYVSHGTPVRNDGTQAYTSECRAAIVTGIGAWITVKTTKMDSYSRSEGRPIRKLDQWFYDDAVSLAVLNPTGQFFNECKHDESDRLGGTWHWPERV